MTLHSPFFSHLCKSTLCWDCTEEKTLPLKCRRCVSAGQTPDKPLLPWHGQSTVAEELLPTKQTWNSKKAILIAGTRTDEISEVRALNMFHWIFSQFFFSLGKISGFLCWWVAVSFSHSNLQVKSFPFPWWVSRHGACLSGSEDAGYLSALGAWKSRSCLKQSREENSFHHLQKCHTLLKRFTRCSD